MRVMTKVCLQFLMCSIGIIGSGALLSGCQTLPTKNVHVSPKQQHKRSKHTTSKRPAVQEEQDGAPKGPIPSFFSAIKPKLEPLSRYGNPVTYQVAGQRYAVLNSARGFKQRGLASWYGTKFHSHRTSSGEHYNMYALTAAHKTLPLPTYVRVKNLENGRVAIVKVNDRGPFHPGRIIDLSYGAATKLGVFPKGTARVEIEAITMGPTKTKYVAPARYYIQAGAFATRRTAEQLRHQIRNIAALPVLIAQEHHKYIVRVGPFTDRRYMERTQALLNRKGIRGSFSLLG